MSFSYRKAKADREQIEGYLIELREKLNRPNPPNWVKYAIYKWESHLKAAVGNSH